MSVQSRASLRGTNRKILNDYQTKGTRRNRVFRQYSR
jgi:hypothetical protein